MGQTVRIPDDTRARRQTGNPDFKCGNVININSQLGRQVLPVTEYHFYMLTKFALTAFTEAIRQELRYKISDLIFLMENYIDVGDWFFS